MAPRVVHGRGTLRVARTGKLGGQLFRARRAAEGTRRKYSAREARRRAAAHALQEGGQLFHHACAQGLCLRQLLRLSGRKLRAEALGVLFKGGAPVRRFQLPGVGVVLQKGDVVRRKAAQLRLQKAQHALGGKAPGGQLSAARKNEATAECSSVSDASRNTGTPASSSAARSGAEYCCISRQMNAMSP